MPTKLKQFSLQNCFLIAVLKENLNNTKVILFIVLQMKKGIKNHNFGEPKTKLVNFIYTSFYLVYHVFHFVFQRIKFLMVTFMFFLIVKVFFVSALYLHSSNFPFRLNLTVCFMHHRLQLFFYFLDL